MLDYKFASSVLLSPYIPVLKEDFVDYIRMNQEINKESNIQLTFEVYLKSQIHYNVLVYSHKRRLSDYNSAYNYICGRGDNLDAYKRVLRYYYEDISDLIFSLDLDRFDDFSLVGNNPLPKSEGIEEKVIDLNQLINDLDLTQTHQINENKDVDLVEILKCIPVKYSGFTHKRLITEASLFKYFSKIGGDIIHITWR